MVTEIPLSYPMVNQVVEILQLWFPRDQSLNPPAVIGGENVGVVQLKTLYVGLRGHSINTDPGYIRTTDTGMTLDYSSGSDITMALGGSAVLSDQYGPAAAWLLDTNMASGGSPDPGHA